MVKALQRAPNWVEWSCENQATLETSFATVTREIHPAEVPESRHFSSNQQSLRNQAAQDLEGSSFSCRVHKMLNFKLKMCASLLGFLLALG
jgi:hypothetical protein